MIDLAFRRSKPKIWAKAIPKIQAEGNSDRPEQPKEPDGAAVPQNVPSIANSAKCSDADVSAIADEAESRGELNQVRQRQSAYLEHGEQGKRQKDAHDWPSPSDHTRNRVGRNVGSGNSQGVEDHLLNFAARGSSAKDMPDFVNGLHSQPAKW